MYRVTAYNFIFRRGLINKKEKIIMFKSEDFIKTQGNYTAEEIIQQPQMWLETVHIIEKKLPEIAAFMERWNIADSRICITGAGSSGYCAEMLAAAINMYLGSRAEAPHTTDIVGSPESALGNSLLCDNIPTLLISLGRSGNSPESIGAVEYARKKVKNLYEICVTCAKDGELCKISAESEKILKIVLPEKTCDRGFAMTSSFTSMALAVYGIFSYKNFADFKNNVSVLASLISAKLDDLCKIAQKAISEKNFDRMAFLGAGLLKGIARESSVKMSELSAGGVNVVRDTPLGFRHGPKSMINDRTFIFHIVSGDSLTRKYDIDLLNELIAQKQNYKIIAVTGMPLGIDGVDYEVAFDTNFANDFYFAVAGIVFSQVFAFYKSQKMGITTDDPCPSGELNRVVKGVTIY